MFTLWCKKVTNEYPYRVKNLFTDTAIVPEHFGLVQLTNMSSG
jgi:hypothetical protein